MFIKNLSIFLLLLIVVFTTLNEARSLRKTRNADSWQKRVRDIRMILNETKDEEGYYDVNRIITSYVDDPLPIADFNISESGFSSYEGQFRELRIHGLKTLQLEKFEWNLGENMFLNLSVLIPEVRLDGNYSLDVSLPFTGTFSGDGIFWMNVTNMTIDVGVHFKTLLNGSIQVDNITLDADYDDINLEFENLGGSMSQLSNFVLNQLSPIMFESARQTSIPESSKKLTQRINENLRKANMTAGNFRTTTVFDNWIAKTREKIINENYEPFKLPDQVKNFKRNAIFVEIDGTVKISDGYLKGLSTLTRTGPVKIIYANKTVWFEAAVGFDSLSAGYNWSADIIGTGTAGLLSIKVEEISSKIRIKQLLKQNAKPTLEVFQIDKINHLWVDCKGLGTWDFILQILVNLAGNAFKHTLGKTVSPAISTVMQNQLDTVEFI